MRRLLSYGFVLFCLVACSREKDTDFPEWDGPVIEFTLEMEEAVAAKAGEEEIDIYPQAGENPYHENDIKWVDFYFYPDGVTSKDASYHIRKEFNSITRSNATLRLELTTNQVNHLIFPVQTETVTTAVAAFVNVPKDSLDRQEDTSLDHLETLVFKTDFEAATVLENHRQQSFMMSGKTIIRLKDRTKKEVIEEEGSRISLSRYACKLTMGIKTEDIVSIPTSQTDDHGNVITEEWVPCVNEMSVYIQDALKAVSLGGTPRVAQSDREVLSYRGNPMLFFRNNGTDANPDYELLFDRTNGYYNTFPTYMYPQKWEDGKEGEPYVKLVLPWERQPKTVDGHVIKYAKKPFYYKILIPKDRRGGDFVNTFTRNNWYHYNIDVGMLGADTDDAAVELDPISLYIFYWQDKNVVIKHADIGNARYLSVAHERDSIYNKTELQVKFTSSHPVSYRVNSASRPYYGSLKPGDDPRIHAVGSGDDPFAESLYPAGTCYLSYNDVAPDWFRLEGGSIIMTHVLENDFHKADFDYSPYTFSLTVYHTDQEEKLATSDYVKDVVIKQYPAIYIDAVENSDPKVIPPGRTEPYDDEPNNADAPVWQNYEHNGYILVDGERRMRHRTNRNEDGLYGTIAKYLRKPYSWNNSEAAAGPVAQQLQWLQWRTVNFTGGNRNRYTIHVSVLPSDSQYIIGDPRTLVPETWNNGYEASCPDKDGVEIPYAGWNDANGDWKVDEGEIINPIEIEFQPAPHITTYKAAPDTKDHYLTWYYPADRADRTLNMLAPALRVASRFGGLEFYSGVTRRSGEFKCATYQEDGYPAGRWRLPTKSEIEFIATLTNKGDFVQLFSPSGKYWSANGAFCANTGMDKNARLAMVRCVYDAWYWDPYDDRLPEGDRDIYVFGDYER